MKLDIHNEPSAHQAAQEAAAWFARHRQGPLSDADALAFRTWLEAAPSHVQAWNSQQRMWSSLQGVRDAPAILALREAARVGLRKHRMRRWAWQAGAALAATFIFGLFMWQQSPQTPTSGSILRATASSALLKHTAEQRALPQVTDVATRIGERALVRLADNSLVTLNTDSAIHVDLSATQRSITLLRGEAYFEVAKDKTRPFVVSAGARQVVAVGTAFAVKLQQQDVQVNLVEGKVRVERIAQMAAAPMSDAVMLDAGMSLLASADGDRVETLNVEREVSWRSGKLVFPGDRLADVVAEMNRYSTQKIELQDAALGEQLLSGVFDPTGGAELARALEGYGMVRIVDQDNTRIVLAIPDHKKNAAL